MGVGGYGWVFGLWSTCQVWGACSVAARALFKAQQATSLALSVTVPRVVVVVVAG